MADPWINWCAEGSDGKVYALEVCDAVEADALGYEIDGVLVSDFITPSWFEPTQADRVDFKRRISKPLQLASGGYISVLGAGGWTQIAAQDESASPIPAGSRRQRRTMSKRSGEKVVALSDDDYFRRQRTPSLVISTSRPAEVNSARMASEA